MSHAQVMDYVQGVVVQGAYKVATHPLGRLPCRATVATAGMIAGILETLKLFGKNFFLQPNVTFTKLFHKSFNVQGLIY